MLRNGFLLRGHKKSGNVLDLEGDVFMFVAKRYFLPKNVKKWKLLRSWNDFLQLLNTSNLKKKVRFAMNFTKAVCSLLLRQLTFTMR